MVIRMLYLLFELITRIVFEVHPVTNKTIKEKTNKTRLIADYLMIIMRCIIAHHIMLSHC